jgi:pimeloyl-ACP methyl ester carboxylesterase
MAAVREKLSIEVNGSRQGMFLTGEDRANPVLLFLHGGPGMPEYWLRRRYPTTLERAFTVAWWEQRGAGLSFGARPRGAPLRLTQLLDDTLEVTDYLRARFAVPKVHLMGHSWGSYLGIQAAARAPERFHSYIGVAQVTHQLRSEALSQQFLIEQYRRRGDHRMVRRLSREPVGPTPPLPRSYESVRDAAMHRLGVGTTHDMRSVVTGIFLPSLLSADYTLIEKADLWRGKLYSRRSPLWDEMLGTDIARAVPDLAVPAYFLHGRHDWTTSYPMAREYAHTLRAPLVGFYTFEGSAHSPQLEEPRRTLTILTQDVLAGRVELADEE